MIQKTYHINDYTEAKLTDILSEVAAMPEYESSAQLLLVLMEQCWKAEITEGKIALIRRMLPKAEIAGTTHFDNLQAMNGHVPHNSILTFMFFDEPAFEIMRIDECGEDEEETGKKLSRFIGGSSDPKCLMTLFSGMPLDIEKVLKTAEQGHKEIPVFGATAGFNTFIVSESSQSFVIDSEGVHWNSLLAVLFCGSNLHVKASYNFGWTEVGRTMTITGLKDPYTVTEIDGMPAADIYQRYLGIPWRNLDLVMENICEFPLSVTQTEKGEGGLERHMARIPYAWTPDGSLHFAIAMHEGEEIRLTYGLPQQIFDMVKDDADGFMSFVPQAMLMVVCMNRIIFLRDLEHIETDYYRSIVPGAAFIHGNSEIFRNKGAGGEMHRGRLPRGQRYVGREIGPQVAVRAGRDEQEHRVPSGYPPDVFHEGSHDGS